MKRTPRSLQRLVRIKPSRALIRQQPGTGYPYLTITDYIQMLNEAFGAAHWSYNVTSVNVLEVSGGIVYTITIELTITTTEETIVRSGIASEFVPVVMRGDQSMDAGKFNARVEQAINALVPSALKSAARTLGKAFGLDLNDNVAESFTHISEHDAKLALLKASGGMTDQTNILSSIWKDKALRSNVINIVLDGEESMDAELRAIIDAHAAKQTTAQKT